MMIDKNLEMLFYTSHKGVNSLMRLVDYLMVLGSGLLFKLSIKLVELVEGDIKQVMRNKALLVGKEVSVSSLTYALTHLPPILLATKVHTSAMLKYVDNLLINQLYSDLMFY